MADPITTANDPIQGAVAEVISAISSLHMIPEPIGNAHDGEFLVHRDRWASHAHQHLKQALTYLRKVRPEDL